MRREEGAAIRSIGSFGVLANERRSWSLERAVSRSRETTWVATIALSSGQILVARHALYERSLKVIDHRW